MQKSLDLQFYRPTNQNYLTLGIVDKMGHLHTLHPEFGNFIYSSYNPNNLESIWSMISDKCIPDLFHIVIEYFGLPLNWDYCIECQICHVGGIQNFYVKHEIIRATIQAKILNIGKFTSEWQN